MRRSITAIILVAAPVLAQERGGMLAGLASERLARGALDAPAVSLRLHDGGLLQAKVGGEWKDSTLDDVAALLRKTAEEYDAEQRKGGKSGYEGVGKARASRLFVSIEADPAAPWKLIQWIMTVVAEQKYYKLELCDGTRRTLAFLPDGRGAEARPAEPPTVLMLSCHIVARAEKPGKWAGQVVLRPAEVRYKFGAVESGSPASAMADAMKEAKRAADGSSTVVRGEIRAGNKVPLGNVLDLMDLFIDNGLPDVDFFAGITPDARRAVILPYPLKNYDAAH